MNLFIHSITDFGILVIKDCESSVKKSLQYQTTEFCYHDKFWVGALALRKSGMWQVNQDELQTEILLYMGYKDLLDTDILLRDNIFNWAVCIRECIRCTSWN